MHVGKYSNFYGSLWGRFGWMDRGKAFQPPNQTGSCEAEVSGVFFCSLPIAMFVNPKGYITISEFIGTVDGSEIRLTT